MTLTTLSSAFSYREKEGQDILLDLLAEPTVALAVDTETTGLRVDDGRDYCIGVSIAGLLEDGTPVSHYFATDHPFGQNIGQETFNLLKQVLEQRERPLIFAHYQFDVLSLLTIGINVWSNEFYDIFTMANIINENRPKVIKLSTLSEEYLHEQGKVDDPFIEKEKKTGWLNTTPELMWEYAVADAVTTWRIWDQLIQHPEWLMLPDDIWVSKQETIRVLTIMKHRGVLVNTQLAKEQAEIGRAEMARCKAELGMNPASHNDMTELFINKLNYPVIKVSAKTKKPSFDKDVMAVYDEILERDGRREGILIREYRGWQKSVTASYEPYLKLLSPDGRLRTEYTTDVVRTGRLSSKDPNLQQISKDGGKPWNKYVKKCFIPKPGYRLLSADYSQLEFRLGAAYADEQTLKAVFNEGRDIFTEMSGQLRMTRDATKKMTYMLQYGAGKKKVSYTFGVDEDKASQMITHYWNTYPRLAAFNERCKNDAELTLRVKMWTGRFRHFEYKSEGYKAMNSKIQGGAADIVERIMVKCFREIDNPDCRLLLQVHDALVFEVREDLFDEYAEEIKYVMEDVQAIVPDRIDGEFGVKFNVEVSDWSLAA